MSIYELGQRNNQEDFLYPVGEKCSTDDRLFILCDGMGGHEHGEVASRTVCLSMADYITKHTDLCSKVVDDSVLLSALNAAYDTLDSMDDGSDRKMGTTLCLLLLHGGGATAMHIGDSRIYHIRPRGNRLLYQSKDHSLVYDLYQSGEISYDEMRTSPQKNILTRAIQPGEDNRVKPSIVHITDIQPDDYFYICSDGMLEQMSNDDLLGIICGKGTEEKKRSLLVASTIENKDNHSAWMIHIDGIEHEAEDSTLVGDEAISTDNAINLISSKCQDVDIVKTEPINVSFSGKQKKETKLSGQLKTILIAIFAIIVFAIAYLVFKNKEGNPGTEINSTSKEKIVGPMQDGVKMKTISRPKIEKLNKAKPLQRDTSKVKEKTDIQQEPNRVDQNNEKKEEKESIFTEVAL